MSHKTIISVDQISKMFGDFRAVDHLSFEVCEGEIFAMLGPNGAGKSTTIRMILDILKPDTGSIAVLGGPINDQKKERIGYLPEERGMYRNVKVIEMMTYLGSLKGMSNSAAHKRSMELLERLGLAANAKSKVSELSKGMQQKVQFAITIIHDPDLVIIDEPFSGLDPVNTLVIKELLLDMPRRGKGVVMSTHQMYQVEEMADRLVMINKGQQALYGSVEDVRRQYAQNAVIVEGKGDWEHLRGIEHIEYHRNGRESVMLYLAPGVTPNDLLGTIAATPNTSIERFERAVPSLNDIFIQVAGLPVEAMDNGGRSSRVLTES